jgi:hypothetical protein
VVDVVVVLPAVVQVTAVLAGAAPWQELKLNKAMSPAKYTRRLTAPLS